MIRSIVLQSLRRSRKGVSTIIAEVFMLLIVILLSAIVFVWVVPFFQANTASNDNSGAAYAEKFSTVWGNFATFAPSIPEDVNSAGTAWTPYLSCTASSPITSPYSGNIYVPPNAVCVITASVGNVYVDWGANLTAIGTTINGQLRGNFSASVTLRNMQVTDWTLLSNVQLVSISGSSLNTSGDTGNCTDACDSAMYEGGRGKFWFVNNTANGQIESEVSGQATVTGNTVNGRLEIESADFGQITNNHCQVLDLDQNGVVVISGNTITGSDPWYPGPALRYGLNRWCSAGNNVLVGSTTGVCIGNIEIDVQNTGSIPVSLIAAYMSNIPLSGPMSWKLLSGGSISNSLPINIPVGQTANITMQWTPPKGTTTLPWLGIYFTFVSSHNNYVDGYIYFGHNPALTITTQSRPANRICPPCY